MAAMVFRQRKWRDWFRFLDANKNGRLAWSELEQSAERFIHEQSLDPASSKKAHKYIGEWALFIMGEEQDDITEEQFVLNLTKLFRDNEANVLTRITRIFSSLVMISDKDEDGYLTEDEFLTMSSVFGFTNEMSRKVFTSIRPEDQEKVVDLGLARDFWIEFVSGDNRIFYEHLIALLGHVMRYREELNPLEHARMRVFSNWKTDSYRIK